MDEKQVHRRRRDAGHPGGRAERRGPRGRQFLALLVRQAVHPAEVEVRRDAQRLLAPEGPDVRLLPSQISAVMGLALQPLGDAGRHPFELGPYPRQIGDRHAVAAEQIEGAAPRAVAGRRDPAPARLAGGQRQRFQPPAGRLEGARPGLERRDPLGAREPPLDPQRRQPPVRVVGPQGQAVLRPRSEHPVGLVDAAGDQIVDQHADVAVGAVDGDGAAAGRPARRVQSGHQSLGGRLLVAGGAVDLAREEQTPRPAGLQRRKQLPRIDVVVLDGVSRPRHLRPLEPRNGLQQRRLRVPGEGGGYPVGIDRVVVQPLRLEEDPVRAPVAEAHDLVLDGGAIAGTRALDAARIQRGPVEVGPDQRVRRRRRRGDVATHLGRRDLPGQKGERRRRVVARLRLQAGVVDGPPVEARRRARLQAPAAEPQPLERIGETQRRRLAGAPRRRPLLAHVDQAPQEGAGRQDHGARADAPPVGERHRPRLRGPTPADDPEILDRALGDRQVPDAVERGLHRPPIEGAVRLRPGASDRRTLAPVQKAELYPGGVRRAAHEPVQRVDLADEVPLPEAADRRVARHLADGARLVRHQQGRGAEARRRRRRLAPGVASPDHDDVEDRAVGHPGDADRRRRARGTRPCFT